MQAKDPPRVLVAKDPPNPRQRPGDPRATMALLAGVAALGLDPMAAAATFAPEPRAPSCPKCKRGEIRRGKGAHYCHRCGWFITAAEVLAIQSLATLKSELT